MDGSTPYDEGKLPGSSAAGLRGRVRAIGTAFLRMTRPRTLREIPITPRADDEFERLIDPADLACYRSAQRRTAARLRGRTLWHVNSAEGGGVAELLHSMLGYLRNGGIDTRWLVVNCDTPFFEITKRIHNRLHGALGDGGPLGAPERDHYDRLLARNLAEISGRIAPGDIVVLHDPQTLGLARSIAGAGASVIWTCHVGADRPTDLVRETWQFFFEDLAAVDVATFTRAAYVWDGIAAGRTALIPPCIDAFSLKNADVPTPTRDAILAAVGILNALNGTAPRFVRGDGAIGSVINRATIDEDVSVPNGAPLVVQVSRWDRLKDPIGVLLGFAEGVDRDVHLILAGPTPASVADDPEAEQVLAEVKARRDHLEPAVRRRIHIANLPILDIEENAVVVNALQQRADVVVQKSLAEGFGLTVTEAMWKGRPIVASRVGGIQDQIEDGLSGRLVGPADYAALGPAVLSLLEHPEQAAAMGAAAKETVRSRYLAPHYLTGYLELIEQL
jgi:trehalose synthase